jgi:hypothetical protein
MVGTPSTAQTWFSRFRLGVAIAVSVSAATAGTLAADYHVSPSGNDANDGRTPGSAWRTVARVNDLALISGDRVRFEGGQTFPGTLALGRAVRGTPEARIVLTSYGEGRATIDGGAGDGIRLDGVAYVDLREINVCGRGRKDGNEHGRGIFPTGCRHLVIDGVEAFGFQHAGVEFQGCEGLRITNVFAHDNGYAGISSGPESAAWSKSVRIDYSRAINNPGDPTVRDNHSGNGIVLYRVNGGVVESCEAAENGWDMPRKGNGPVGIWVAYCRDVTIQYNISHHNKTASGAADGGGFDLDGDSIGCTLQYNYSHDNYGAGILLCTWSDSYPLRDNIVRYNISDDDGRTNHHASLYIYRGDLQSHTQVYHNVFSNSGGRHGVSGWTPRGFSFHNNVFLLSGGGQFVHEVGDGTFQGNLYWDLDGPGRWDGHPSLAAWREATGKETLDDAPVGRNLDPLLALVGPGEKLTDPTRLPKLLAYRQQPGSPCRDAGLDLPARFGIHPGVRDLFGNPIPRDAGFDIGVHEAEAKSPGQK